MAFGKKERPTVDKDGAALVMRKRDYLADFSGQLGLGLMANLVGQLQYFYTDKVGIAVGSVGVVMVIAKVVDALTDIWFGNIIDHSTGDKPAGYGGHLHNDCHTLCGNYDRAHQEPAGAR